jgi:tetratricopeptide (TPR) repeat protein
MKKLAFVLFLALLGLHACRESYLQPIRFYITQRDWEKAKQELQKLLESDPENGELHFLLADVFAHLNDFEQMHQHFQAAQAHTNRFDASMNYQIKKYSVENYNAGVVLRQQKNFEKAIEKFTFATMIEPRNPDAYIQMAHIFLAQENFGQAIHFYERAIDLNRKDIISRTNLAWIFFKQRNLEKTITVCLEILKIDSKHYDSILRLAYCYDLSSDYSQAIKWYSRAIQLNPREKKLFVNLGINYYNQAAYPAAITQFENALKLDSTSVHLYNYLGESFRQTHRYEDMIRCYQTLVELEPQNTNAWKNLISAYGGLGDQEQVEVTVEQMLKQHEKTSSQLK